MCKPFRHADAFYHFDLWDVDASEIRCVCYYIRMLFLYLDLRDIWSPLSSPLRLPVPPSRLGKVSDRLAQGLRRENADGLGVCARCPEFSQERKLRLFL